MRQVVPNTRRIRWRQRREDAVVRQVVPNTRRIRWRQTETRGCSSETSGAQHKEDKVETDRDKRMQ